MRKRSTAVGMLLSTLLITSGLFVTRAQDNPKPEDVFQIPNCALFGAGRDKNRFVPPAGASASGSGLDHPMSAITAQVTGRLAYASAAVSTGESRQAAIPGNIDKYIFAALQEAGVNAAGPTTDSEFIRRVTMFSAIC